MRIILALLICAAPGAAFAAGVTLDAKPPFKIDLGRISEIGTGADVYSVIEMTVTNGLEYYLSEVKIHCDAGNKDGYTWNVTGRATNLDRGETRKVRLLSTSPLQAQSRNGDRAKCLISSYTVQAF